MKFVHVTIYKNVTENWNTAKVGVKHQTIINQSINLFSGVNGGKLYLQVKHQQHFGIHGKYACMYSKEYNVFYITKKDIKKRLFVGSF